MPIGVTCKPCMNEGNVTSLQSDRLTMLGFVSVGGIQRYFDENKFILSKFFMTRHVFSTPFHPEEFIFKTLAVAARISE